MQETSGPIAERIRELLSEVGFDQVRSILGVSRATFYNWRSGKSAPSVYQVLQVLDARELPISWLVEQPPARERLAQRVQEALKEYEVDSNGEKCASLNPSDLFGDPIFEAALQWHRESRGFFGDGSQLLDKISTFSLIQGERQDGIFDFQHFGAGSMAAAYYGVEFADQPKNCQDVADREFEDWAAQFYRSVITDNAPICHDISKVVTVKHVTRLVHYRRLVLPGRTTENDVVIVIARESAPSKILNGLTLVG